jgi:phage FluMu gp28-like protein
MKQEQGSRLKRLKNELAATDEITVPQDPVEFVRALFKFEPKEYQAKLLEDKSKRIVVRWSRQAGKTTTIALRALWYAFTNPKSLSLIVAPSLRQSMILGDRVQDYLASLQQDYRAALIDRQQRTVIRFTNSARIVILPNSPQLLRGYTAHQVICDEAAFFREDELVFYNVLYPMLATTDGILIASSTPWSKDSVFYRMCQSNEFSKHVVTCEDVVKAGLIKQDFIEEMKTQLPEERFKREFNAEFVEDIDAWLTQSLIVNCIDSQLQPYTFEDVPKGSFYLGVDFGKEQDFSVIIVVERTSTDIRVIHIHRFPLKMEYASVIGYVKSLQDRWHIVRAVYADVTGVGNYIVEDMTRSGIRNVEGINFTVQSKEELATILREQMRSGKVHIPYVPISRRGDVDLTAELNVEKSELAKSGHIRFSHPDGAKDDVFWATALAVSAAVKHPVLTGIVDFGKTGDK